MYNIELLYKLFLSQKLYHSWLIHTKKIDHTIDEIKKYFISMAVDNTTIDNALLKYIHDIPKIDNISVEMILIERQLNSSNTKAKYITIDQIRELKQKLNIKNADHEYRFIIIREADLLNKNAQNCFLKILEEPNKNNFLFLISANLDKISDTICSRCQKLSVFIKQSINNAVYNKGIEVLIDDLKFVEQLSLKVEKDYLLEIEQDVHTYAKRLIEVGLDSGDLDILKVINTMLQKVIKTINDTVDYDLDCKTCLVLIRRDFLPAYYRYNYLMQNTNIE